MQTVPEPLDFDESVQRHLDTLDEADAITRLWQRDPGLFTQDTETRRAIGNRLGWLDPVSAMRTHLHELSVLARIVERQGYDRLIVVGMGGSSLWPEVVGRHLKGKRGLPLRVADSSHPEAVAEHLQWADKGKPLFIIASKSGTTVETLSIYRVFRDRFEDGEHFIAVTDPDSPLDTLAQTERFRAIFRNPANIGGRFSAATLFGLVPAVLAGVVVKDALKRVEETASECRLTPASHNPAAQLAAFLAAAVATDRWQLRLSMGKGVRGFCDWVEQLLAESTGKAGGGVLPVPRGISGEGETLAHNLRHAVVASMTTFRYPNDPFLERCEDAYVPSFSLVMPHQDDLWNEVLRWQVATALVGFLIDVNPFDEPDVASAKDATSALLNGQLQPIDVDTRTVDRLVDVESVCDELLGSLSAADYLAVLCFMAPTERNRQHLASLRAALQAQTAAAVSVQFGPRYLHSTGQYHKGGVARGHFVVVDDLNRLDRGELEDMPIPGASYTLGQLIRAQADGDVHTLVSRGRPVIRVNLG